MQEAYQPWCIKYSICYLRWGTPRQGYPPSQVWWGGTPGGVLPTGPGGVPPVGLGWGTPLSGPGRGTPPPGVDRQMDRHMSKHNLPVVVRTRSVIKSFYYLWGSHEFLQITLFQVH